MSSSPAALPLNLMRGFLIGLAELVPGVSGGTIALVTGIYDELIASADHVVKAILALIKGPHRLSTAKAHLSKTNWSLVGPLLVGMAIAVLVMAGVMKNFVTMHPELARGLFLGLVAVSVIVPLRMVPRRKTTVVDVLAFGGSAIAMFIVTGLTGAQQVPRPPLILVFFAAAIAICALVLPGVSGSFFLLVVGFYAATMTAISSRDLVYIAVFAIGAVCGLASFVRLLNYVLHHRRRVTLLVMAGLMVGSLRALWPWQAPPQPGELFSHLQAPHGNVWLPLVLMLVGGALVWILIQLEQKLARTQN